MQEQRYCAKELKYSRSIRVDLPAMQEICVGFLGGKYHLEKEMETHSSVLAWRILWTEKPGRLQSMWSQESDMT